MASKNAGFTLAEIAIVIMIIGLLAASIVGGRALLQSYEQKSIITNVSLYKDAIKTFETKYQGLPGDISWNSSPFATVAGLTVSAGNGDGIITWSNASHPTSSQESYQAWLQLTLAEMIKGTYTGAASASSASKIDVNVPASKVNGAGFTIINLDRVAGGGNDVADFYSNPASPLPTMLVGNYFAFGGETANSYTSSPAISQKMAYALDLKIDDGLPNSGAILATPAATSPTRCITIVTAASNNITYDLTSTEAIQCNLYFKF